MGPMFAGKTRELLRRLDYHRISTRIQNVHCLLIKSKKDNRYDSKSVVSHNPDIREKNCLVVDRLKEITADQLLKVQHIFVDEGQFFEDLVPVILCWIESGRDVTVAALDAFANHTMWPNIADLVPWCNNLTKLHAACYSCGESAPLTVKKNNNDDKKIQVGGGELYRASCIACRKLVI
jgi:thymidine kinase